MTLLELTAQITNEDLALFWLRHPILNQKSHIKWMMLFAFVASLDEGAGKQQNLFVFDSFNNQLVIKLKL